MKFTPTIVLALVVVFANLGGIYAPPTTGPGFVYIAGEIAPNNGPFNGYFKVGGAGINMDRNTKRTKMNTYNPRRLDIIIYYPVNQTQAAETAALNALRPNWGVNLGGGTEWFYVNLGNWNNFRNQFINAVQPYLRANG